MLHVFAVLFHPRGEYSTQHSVVSEECCKHKVWFKSCYIEGEQMADILQTTFHFILLNWNAWISIRIALKFLLKGPINNQPTLVEIKFWFRAKMMTWFTETYTRHQAVLKCVRIYFVLFSFCLTWRSEPVIQNSTWPNISLFGATICPDMMIHVLPNNSGRVTHICVGYLTIIGSDNGLSPCRRQAIIWTNAGISLIGPLGTNFNDILTKIHTFSWKKNASEKVARYNNLAAILSRLHCVNYNSMNVWILAGNGINFSIAAGLIRLHMPGVK